VCLFASVPALAADLVLLTGGKVSIELQYSDAAFSNTMSLVAPASAAIAVTASGTALDGCKIVPGVAGLPGIPLISEKNSQHGCRVELDADPAAAGVQGFPAGTVLRFAMCARVSGVSPGCDYIWSSNPALNTGAGGYSPEADPTLDHLKITPIHNAEYPGRIFQLAWEDKPANFPSDRDFNDLVAIVRIDIDSDGDGLWDDWEEFGVDADGDGVADVNLPALGAHKMRKDVFVWLDYMDCSVPGGDCPAGDMHTHRPKAAAIAMVKAAFANAYTVANPDNSTGINLVVEIGTAIKHQNTLVIPNTCMTVGPALGNFDVEKAANFGLNNPRRFTHHYGIFAHLQDSAGHTGCAERPGNDLLVTLGNAMSGDRDGDGSDDGQVGTVLEQAGTFMHELGHNLGLQHGGIDDINYKPNYLSVMSYSFQQAGIPLVGGGPPRLDYSKMALPTLDETSLNEAVGIGLPAGAPEVTKWMCPNYTAMTGPAGGGINWTCTGGNVDAGFAQDVNGDRRCIGPGPDGILNSVVVPDDVVYAGAFIHDGTNRTCDSTAQAFSDDQTFRPPGDVQPRYLTGFDDWSNLNFRFQESASFDDGDRPPGPLQFELDTKTILERTAPDPGVDIDATPIAIETGSQVTYDFAIRNNSAEPASGVQLTDNLPAALSFVSCSAPGGSCGAVGSARAVKYVSLGGGAAVRATMVAKVSCALATGTVITNNAVLSSLSADSDLLNNQASVKVVAINPSPVISGLAVDQPSLSPPDGRWVLVTVSYEATDNCAVGQCTLSVSSDARHQNGAPTYAVLDDHQVVLRAESNGTDKARVYTILVTCTDNAGAKSVKRVTVVVPQ
jgi:uncharacterized repeat protein (TIGR01451 family)